LTCGGQLGSETFTNNPQYKIDPSEPGKVTLVLSQRDIALSTEIGLYVFRVPKCATIGKLLNIHEDPIVSPSFNNRFETTSDFEVDPQFHYFVIPATKSKGVETPFLLRAFCTKPFQFHLSHVGVKLVRL
jgi:tRNA A37 threonylcarbamoyladenosine synthetase subunit TsaC/SUA5/YrdC